MLRSNLISTASENKYRDAYNNAKPYRWCVFDELCDVARMKSVHDEIVTHMRATSKETDL